MTQTKFSDAKRILAWVCFVVVIVYSAVSQTRNHAVIKQLIGEVAKNRSTIQQLTKDVEVRDMVITAIETRMNIIEGKPNEQSN